MASIHSRLLPPRLKPATPHRPTLAPSDYRSKLRPLSNAHRHSRLTAAAPPSRGRGRYDRSTTPAARAALQRSALLHATAAALLECPRPSVREVLERAGLSRATFYAHFPDLRTARSAVAEAAASAVDRAALVLLPPAPDAPSRVRALALALAAAHRAVPDLVAAARLPSTPPGSLSPLERTLTNALRSALAHPGPSPPDTPATAPLLTAAARALLATPPELLLPPSDLPDRLARTAELLLRPV